MGRQRLLILGAGSFAEEVADIVDQMEGYELTAFVESRDPSKAGQRLNSRPILWVDEIEQFAESHSAIAALGTTQRDQFIEQVSVFGIRFATLIHPSVQLSPSCSVEEGTFVGAGVVIAAHSRIGRHVLINRGCLIGHHTSIGPFSVLCPGANIAGGVTVHKKVFVGMGAQILNNLEIGAEAVIGAGAVVTRHVAPRCRALGNPARVFKEGI